MDPPFNRKVCPGCGEPMDEAFDEPAEGDYGGGDIPDPDADRHC